MDPFDKKEDPQAQQENCDRLDALLLDVDPRDLYPALRKALATEGWDDPQMDDYNGDHQPPTDYRG